MRKFGNGVLAFILVLSFLFSSTEAYANSITDLKNKGSDINSQLKDTESKLQSTNQQKKLTIEEIDRIDEDLVKVIESINDITANIEKNNIELERVEKELKEAEAARDRQYEAFKTRSRYIYMNGSMSYVDVIFSSKSVTDLIKRIDYVNRIVEYDKNLVTSLKESEELVSVKLEEAQKQRDDLEVMEFIETQQMHSYEQMRVQKEAVIKELENDAVEYLRQIEQLDASSKEVEKQIQAMEAEQRRKELAAQAAKAASTTSVYTYDGNALQWPLPGKTYISSYYGPRQSPISGKNENHSGVDIPASYGTQVLAAEGGTVVTAGWMNGYGYTVVISHGSGLSTLYGHNSSLLVKQGDTVSRGQAIAKVGSTGWSTGNHVHFEVRINGKPDNPLKYSQAK